MIRQTSKAAYIISWLSVALNIVLFAGKLAARLSVGSVAMTADAWHTLSDSLTSLIVIFGFWISSKPRDREHPFGHGRMELIASIVVGTLLMTTGFNFIADSVSQLRDSQRVEFSYLSVSIFAVSFLLKEGMAQASIRIGKKLQLKSLEADGRHHRSDALASILIVVGAFSNQWIWWLDGVMGLVVSLLIVHTAWQIIRESADILMGEVPGTNLLEQTERIIAKTAPEVDNFHHFQIHRYGDHLEATLHLELPGDYSLRRAHDIAISVEEALFLELDIRATIHCDPVETKRLSTTRHNFEN